ncbi:MAG: SurA N-terminal domain-containing protein [Gammaproteobacteria bacterium]
MLQKIREKITGWVAGIILALLAVVFAVWGIDFSFTPPSVAATVNGDEVPVEPVRRAYQDQLSRFQQSFAQDVPEEIQQELRRGVIEQFVRRTLLEQRVDDAGYRIGDEALAAHIRTVPAFQVGGQFNRDAYRAALAGAGYSPTAFEEDQRRLLEIQQLQDGIARSTFVTDAELERRVALREEERDVEWLSLSTERFLDQVEVTEDDIRARYESTREQWMTPEKVDIAYLDLELADLAGDVQLSDEDIAAFYEAEKAREPQRFSAPERRKASHILVRVDEETDEAAARARAEALKARIEGGEDFAAVAEEASDDPGSARQGGDLGWVERGMMVPAFDEALFAIRQTGTVSDPVRSEFGFHLIRVDEIEEGHTQTLDEVRDQLAQELSRRRAEDRFFEMAEDLARLTFENPGTLDPAAEALGLEIRTADGVTRGGGGTSIASQPRVQDAIWSESVLESRENSELIEVEDGRAVVVRVREYYPAEQRPLEEVADTIESQLRREKALEATREQAAEAESALAAGTPLSEVAEGAGADFVSGVSVKRDDDSVPPAVVRAAFQAARPGDSPTAATADGANGIFVVRVMAARPGQIDALSETDRNQLRQELIQAQAGEELNAYLEHLRNQADVSVFQQALE